MGWTIAGTLIRYMKGRAREQALAKRAADADGRAGQGSVARAGGTQGRHGREEGTARVEGEGRASTRPQDTGQGGQGAMGAGPREAAEREGSDGEGTGKDAHEGSTQQTQERQEEEAQGGGVEQQSTRAGMAGAAAEEESRHVGTRNGEGTQEQTQDGHEGGSAHDRRRDGTTDTRGKVGEVYARRGWRRECTHR